MPDSTAESSAANSPTQTPSKPAKLEDKPFKAFIEENFIPELNNQLSKRGYPATRIELVNGERPVTGGTC